MRVLLFGREFPPHIAGGLGTACYGMTRGLARNDVDVTFVVPHAYGDEDQRFTHVLNASDVEALYGSTGSGADDILEKMSFIHIDSNMVPYISPEEYEQYQERYVKSGQKVWSTTDAWKQRYTFSGKYGANLMEEVARYAVVAAQVAKDLEGQFDVIHAHDCSPTTPVSPPSAYRASRWSCICTPRNTTAAARTSTRRSTPSNVQACMPQTG